MKRAKFGVKIDQHLNWGLHIEDISRKIAKSIGILYKCRHYLPTNVMTNLYYSFIYPYISYCTLTWGSNYQTKLKPIHILQKRAIRAILFADNRTPSKPLFSRLQVLTIHEITRMQQGEFMYRRLNNLLPDNIFDDYIKPISHRYNTRSKANKELYIRRTNTNYGKFDIKYSAAKLWNDIPLGIRNSSSLAIFKKQFKKYILSS